MIAEHRIVTGESIPVLFYYSEGAENAPIVFCMHGYCCSKHANERIGVKFAEAGFFAVLPDARMHGERSMSDFSEKFDNTNFFRNFFNVVKETVEDVTRIIDYLKDIKEVDTGRVGITGMSMGGHTAFMAALYDKRIKAAAPIIGTPDWTGLFDFHPNLIRPEGEFLDYVMQFDPLTHYENLYPTALLIQNGVKDDIVPIAGARRLDDKLKRLYKSIPEKYILIEYPEAGHEVTQCMIDAAVDWFRRYL
ncbi:MAG: alpha/beta hydrolase family protein [Saccharofermentanales bacterium]